VAKTIKSFSNEELLAEYASLQRWAGDDFSMNPIPDKEVNRGYRIAAEILRRMQRT